MKRSRYMLVLALLGVLLNAALVVRHNSRMLDASLASHVLDADLKFICQNGSEAPALPDSDQAPSPGMGECPICMGVCPAVAILSQPLSIAPVIIRASERVVVIGEIITRRLAAVRPPQRGPPLIV